MWPGAPGSSGEMTLPGNQSPQSPGESVCHDPVGKGKGKYDNASKQEDEKLVVYIISSRETVSLCALRTQGDS